MAFNANYLAFNLARNYNIYFHNNYKIKAIYL